MLLHALTRHTWGPYHLFQQKSGINLLQLCRLQLHEIHLRRRLQRRRVDCSLLLLMLLHWLLQLLLLLLLLPS
jgi:hypothetical protein